MSYNRARPPFRRDFPSRKRSSAYDDYEKEGEDEDGSSASSRTFTNSFSDSRNSRQKRQPPPRNNRNRQRRPQKNETSAEKKPDQVFTKAPVESCVMSQVMRSFYPVFTSNLGCTVLGDIVYQTMHSKQSKLTLMISRDHFLYVIHLCFVNRVVQTAIKTGTGFAMDAELLRQVTSSIELPDIICKFIESLGIVPMLNGIKVVPHCAVDYAMYTETPWARLVMFEYASLLDGPPPANAWAIDPNVVLKYNEDISKAKPSSMNFRTIGGFDTCDGRPEMLCGYKTEPWSRISSYGPQAIPEATQRLGGMYHFRDQARPRRWKPITSTSSILHALFQTPSFAWQSDFAKMCSDSFATKV